MDADPLALLEPAATTVRDPVSGKSAWLANLIRHARMDGEVMRFDLVFSAEHDLDARREVELGLIAAIAAEGFTGKVVPFVRREGSKGEKPAYEPHGVVGLTSGEAMMPHGGPIEKKPIPGVRAVIAVASGKGGVGKSTVATNLAVGLRRAGLSVGLLDADVYGPSLPRMMGTRQKPMVAGDGRMVPVMSFGVKCVSMGLLIPAEQAVIWRGPMVMDAIRKFLQNVWWGDLDVLVVDLPPGTGDVQLTLIEALDLNGAVIVTTPQDVALDDAIRGITMFDTVKVPIIGVVENMAFYELPDGTRDYVFGEGGGERVAKRFGVDLIAQIPLQTKIRTAGDSGNPISNTAGSAFQAVVDAVQRRLPENVNAP